MEPTTLTALGTLLPQVAQLLREVKDSEIGQAIDRQGKRFLEIAIPTATKASQIMFEFLSGSPKKTRGAKTKTITLTKPLDIVEGGLSLPRSYRKNQFIKFPQEITNDLDIIKGQNEILFLSNSINYFVESHKSRTGIDRAISHALQYDTVTVCNHLKKQRKLRFPGYLLHQFTSLSETIKELNIFYWAILEDGSVPGFDEGDVREELAKEFGIERQKGQITRYIPYDLKIKILRNPNPGKSEKQPRFPESLESIREYLKFESEDELHDVAHDALFTLKEELVANEELEDRIVKRLNGLGEKKMIVQSTGE